LSENLEGKDHLRDLDVDDWINRDLKERVCGNVNWIQIALKQFKRRFFYISDETLAS
jgi:hypothetical protein